MITAKSFTCTTIIQFLQFLSAPLFILLLFANSVYATNLFIGTDKEGYLSHFTGKNICRIIQMYDADIQCNIVEAANSSEHNLTNLQTGALDLALIDSGVLYDAINKTGTFQFHDISFENVSYLVPMYKKHISLLVKKNAKISELNDLKGKRLNIGVPGSEQFRMSEIILEIKNWTKADFKQLEQLPTSQSQDYLAFNMGSIQAMFHIGVHPNSSIRNVLSNERGKLVNLNDSEMDTFVENNPGYFYVHIPAKTYPYQNSLITTYGTEVTLLANKDLDNDLVLTILAALFKKQDWLRKSHPALSLFNLEKKVLIKPVVDYHPGAEMFFSQ